MIATDKNGKEIILGSTVVYDGHIATVHEVDEKKINLILPHYSNLLFCVYVKDYCEKLEVLNEQEVTLFLLKNGKQ